MSTYDNHKWQWMDDRHGGQGWFTDEDRVAVTPLLVDGYWRRLDQSEVDSMNAYVNQLTYEQG